VPHWMDESLSVRGVVLPSIGDFHRYVGSFVINGILFSILNTLVLGPLFTLTFAGLVRWGGDRVMSNEEIYEFFLSPIGVGAIIVLITASMTTVMTQQAGLMIIFSSLRMRRPIGSIRALLAMLFKLPGILAINLLRAVALMLMVLPFAGTGTWLYFSFLGDLDLNYLVQVRPPAFWWGAAGVGVLILCAVTVVMAVHVRMIFAFPAYFFGGRPLLGALGESFRLTKGHTFGLIRIFVTWLACAAILNIALSAVLEQLGPWLVPLAGRRLELVAAVIGLVLAIQSLAHAALNLFTIGVNAIGMARCYILLTPGDELSVPADAMAGDESHRRARWAIAAVCVAFVVGAGVSAYGLLESSDLVDQVTITAHRGSSRAAPENTLSAIEQAIEDGADYAEIDVQETADGVVVLIHDTDLKRITGLREKIWEVTYDEIRDLDFGSWFSPEFADERIPTLAEAIETADGRIGLNIEIKLNGHERQLVESVVRIIEETGFEEQCIVTSLSHRALREVARLNPELDRGYIVYQTMGSIDRLDTRHVMLKASLATTMAVNAAHDADKTIHVWTVNDPTRMSFMIDRGVDGILTDYPETLVRVLDERSELSDFERLLLRFAEFISG
jgi:glycerophosphoryl diester phosphodiesterase